jgi:hypothetical protein
LIENYLLNVLFTVSGDSSISGNTTIGNISTNNIISSNINTNTLNLGVTSSFSNAFNASNNVSSPSNVIGLSFSNADIRYFMANISVNISRTTNVNLYEIFTLECYQNDAGWSMYVSSLGDTSGVMFNITSGGQIQYTSSNIDNFSSSTFRYSINQISKNGTYISFNNPTQGTYIIDSMQITNTANTIIGSNVGALYVQGGSLFEKNITINTTNNSSGIGTGGALTILGGASISKDLYVGASISTNSLNANIINLNTGITSASAQITNANVTTSTIATLRVPINFLGIGNSNTLGSIITTGGNVGINITSPSATLDIGGTVKITTSLTTGAIYATNITATNMVATSTTTGTLNATGLSSLTNVSATNQTLGVLVATTGLTTGTINATGLSSLTNTSITNLSATNIIGTTVSASTLVGTTITGGNLSLSGNLFVGGTLTTVNITSTNFVDTNVSAGTMNVSGLSSLTTLTVSGSSTLGNLNVPGGFSAPNAYVTVWGLTASTNVTTGAVYATNSTITNIVSTNVTVSTVRITGNTFILGGGIYPSVNTTTGSDFFVNVYGGTLSVNGNLYMSGYNITSIGSLNSTNIVSSSAQITTSTIATLLNTNVVSTNMTSATLNLSTSLTAASARIMGSFQAINNSNTMGSIYTTGGNVGVNTVTPNTYLQIAGTASTYGHLFINDANPTIWGGAMGGSGATLTLKAGYGAGGETDSQRSKFQINGWNSDANQVNAFVFKTNGDTERMRIINSGNVGIGTSSPSFTLDVSGTSRISTSLTTGAVYATNMVATSISSSALIVSGNLKVNSIEMNSGGGRKQISCGVEAGGSAAGTVNFPFTFTNIPAVVANIIVNDSTSVFCIQIGSVSTTGFTYRKTFYRFAGAYGGDAVSEGFYWTAIG